MTEVWSVDEAIDGDGDLGLYWTFIVRCNESSANIFMLNDLTFRDSCCFLLSNAGVWVFLTQDWLLWYLPKLVTCFIKIHSLQM